MWPVADDWRALIGAELSGPSGTGTDIQAWKAAAAAADLGRLPADRRIYTRIRLAEAHIHHGDKASATTTLQQARELAQRFMAERRLREVSELSERAGLAAPTDHRAPGERERLTAREHQVLQLIADGLSNKQIGQQLFISTKTASVHVSAILRKLGATGRTEAAVMLQRGIPG